MIPRWTIMAYKLPQIVQRCSQPAQLKLTFNQIGEELKMEIMNIPLGRYKNKNGQKLTKHSQVGRKVGRQVVGTQEICNDRRITVKIDSIEVD